jgi:glycosyltransferase involved in cell wall biosynthesis
MSILFGHPTGNPNSHQAALAHFESSRLEAFCVPWFPSKTALAALGAFPPTRSMATRLERRRFEPLAGAPKIQGRIGEIKRLAVRALGRGDEGLSYEANDWLMRTMARECHRPSVTAVHAYEDCSLWQFEEAKRRGKACIYDMPIGYYPAWQETEDSLAKKFSDWIPAGGLASHKYVRPEQKRREMELADVVIVPSTFVERTVKRFIEKPCMLAQYGVDTDFWQPTTKPKKTDGPLRFIYVGQLSIRKGTPILIEAWTRAALKNAEIYLVGTWLLADRMRRQLPSNVRCVGPCSKEELRSHYQSADVFVFPSFFEGFALVLLEAMACGLPVIASDASGATDIIDQQMGRLLPPGEVEAWTDGLRFMAERHDQLSQMKAAARAKALQQTWGRYRRAVCNSVAAHS